MTSRERVKTIFAGEKADRCGFWLGMPHPDTWPIYLKHFNTTDEEQVPRALGDDIRWLCAEWNSYRHPEGRPLFNMVRVGISGGTGPVFADCEDVDEVEAHEWPNPDYLDFTEIVAMLRRAGDVYRASGMWGCFDEMLKIDRKMDLGAAHFGLLAKNCDAAFGWCGFSNYEAGEQPL